MRAADWEKQVLSARGFKRVGTGALRICHINGMEVRKKTQLGVQEEAQGVQRSSEPPEPALATDLFLPAGGAADCRCMSAIEYTDYGYQGMPMVSGYFAPKAEMRYMPLQFKGLNADTNH